MTNDFIWGKYAQTGREQKILSLTNKILKSQYLSRIKDDHDAIFAHIEG